jgi:histidinol phosphatase-like PHP family hydrolase
MPNAKRSIENVCTPAILPRDMNVEVAGLLLDMSALQQTKPSGLGYKRAAYAVFSLDRPVVEYAAASTLRDIRGIGPSSERIILEWVAQGTSSRVDAALRQAPASKQADILKRRAVRDGFLSWSGVLSALRSRLPARVVSLDQYRGDLQMHTVWSDGVEDLETMAAASVARGWTRMCVTDHSYGLPVARGMSMEQVGRQHEQIDAINRRFAGAFRIWKGIEANILADGRVDMPPDELQRFELVVAAPHSVLRKADDQSERMIAAVETPGVHILGHPRGRMFNNRAGIQADWDRVFAAAARAGVAIELDGTWDRQDVDAALAARAVDAGCVFAIDSDAHAGMELEYVEYGLAHARLARIPADRVINCWDDERLLAWATQEPKAPKTGTN